MEIEKFAENVRKASTESTTLLIRKQMDYGPRNIMDSPGGPINGLTVRLFDKLARLRNLIENNGGEPQFESLRDTLLDISNYGLIGVMVLDNTFDDTEEK
jgi:hypothetical protein